MVEQNRHQVHLAPPGTSDGLVQEAARYVEGFLCKAWGETDLPEARIVRTREEWEAFVVEAQWGDDAKYSALESDDREMVDAQVRYIVADMADNGEGSINFEIGGISVERVTFPPTSAPTVNAVGTPASNGPNELNPGEAMRVLKELVEAHAVPRELMQSCEAAAEDATMEGFAQSQFAERVDRFARTVYRMGFESGWRIREQQSEAAWTAARNLVAGAVRE